MNNSEKILSHLEVCGLDIIGRSGDEVTFDCPSCQKEHHAHFNVVKQLWHCKYCDDRGDRWKLLDLLVKLNEEVSGSQRLCELAVARRLPVEAFDGWGIAYLGGQYHLPVRNRDGSLTDLRRYRVGGKIMSAPGAHTGLFGAHKLADLELQDADVFLLEGAWDCISMAHLLSCAGHSGIALGAPGAGTFKVYWISLFEGRNVHIVYDHDLPGLKGAQKVANALKGYAKSVHRYAWAKSVAPGFDVNDLVSRAVEL